MAPTGPTAAPPATTELAQAVRTLAGQAIGLVEEAAAAFVADDPDRGREVGADHRQVEQAVSQLEHLALVGLARAQEPAEEDRGHRHLAVAVLLAQIADRARALAPVVPVTGEDAVDIDGASLLHAMAQRCVERARAAVEAFLADAEPPALVRPDPTMALLLARLQERAADGPGPARRAKGGRHLAAIDGLTRSVAALAEPNANRVPVAPRPSIS